MHNNQAEEYRTYPDMVIANNLLFIVTDGNMLRVHRGVSDGKINVLVASCLRQFEFLVSCTRRGQYCNRILGLVSETNFVTAQDEMKMELVSPK